MKKKLLIVSLKEESANIFEKWKFLLNDWIIFRLLLQTLSLNPPPNTNNSLVNEGLEVHTITAAGSPVTGRIGVR